MIKYFPVLKYINRPNLITTIGLAFAVAAGYFMVAGSLRNTFICLALAMIMDFFDGFFAGKLDRQTSFGQSFDSLVDSFVCCVMPVLMVFTFVGIDMILVIAAGFYCICGLWRLSHYNVMAQSTEKSTHFTGLPVPGASLLNAMVLWLVVYHNLAYWVLAPAMIILGLMMISFFKLQKYGLMQKLSWVVGLIFLIVVLIS